MMKPTTTRLSQCYALALRAHLQPGATPDLQPALKLGRQAAAFGLEPRELARIHEQAIATLKLSPNQNGRVREARIFFTEALTPIVATHCASQRSKMDLQRLSETLNQRTRELAATHRRLQQDILRRQRVETTLQQSGKRYARLLKDAQQLQQSLRRLTQQRLVAQEEERKQVSSKLQDEIAQTLLGINVRLLTMKKGARGDARGLKKEIVGTRQLVVKSACSLKQAARKFRNP
jgi:signal transduction histidine kinase